MSRERSDRGTTRHRIPAIGLGYTAPIASFLVDLRRIAAQAEGGRLANQSKCSNTQTMSVLKVLISLLLALLPVVVLVRDWKFHDRRTKKHHLITRGIVVLWLISSVAAAILVWSDSSRINELIEGTNTLIAQNDSLSAKLDNYQMGLDETDSGLSALEEATRPRSLTEEQATRLIALVSFESDFSIGIVCRALDTESCEYAQQIADVFRNARWRVLETNQTFLDDIESDICVIATDGSQDATAGKIRMALNAVDIASRPEKIRDGSVADIKANTIYLFVGAK